MRTSGSRDIKAVICDPRLMRKFAKLAGELGLTYSVPKEVGVKVSADVIIIDDECLEHYEINSNAAYLVTNSNIESVVSEVAGVRRASALMVGVDLGASIAYAAFADRELVSAGKVCEPKDFFQRLRELMSFIEPRKVIIKVGLPETNNADEVLGEVIEGLLKMGCITYLVDESRTSTEAPKIALRRLNVKDDDILAAINIALRSGMRVT